MNVVEVQAVIFDVDGTLYDQSRLRRKMLFALLKHYAIRPWRYRDLLILQKFRSVREKKAGASGDIENMQYRWVAEAISRTEAEVRSVVNDWIFNKPNEYLKECVLPGTREFMDHLRGSGIKVAIYSDYRAHEKLKAMDLQADLIVSSTDPEVDRFKPAPDGLLYIVQRFGLRTKDCLFIGDRQEMDGECAENAKMPYMIIPEQSFDSFDFYFNLQKQFSPTLRTHGTSINSL